MTNNNGRLLQIFTACAATAAAAIASAAFYTMSTRASEADVAANSVKIASQEIKLAAQEVKLAAQEVSFAAQAVLSKERDAVVGGMTDQITSIDRALNILVEGYQESK
jgi:hypothetical protein